MLGFDYIRMAVDALRDELFRERYLAAGLCIVLLPFALVIDIVVVIGLLVLGPPCWLLGRLVSLFVNARA